MLPELDGGPFFDGAVLDVQRLSTTGHWIVPVELSDGPLHLLGFSATPPIFDGPEDRNGLRNRDELRLWGQVLDGGLGAPPADFIVLGNANLDPLAGDGHRAAMVDFLARPDLQDPLPGQPTARWPVEEGGPGDLRVSYVLPAISWRVMGAGVVWPASDRDGAAGPHYLVWVDVAR